MPQVTITSTGSYLPGEPLTNADLERLVGPLPEDILEGIQVKRRHWMIDPETGEHRISNSEMATRFRRSKRFRQNEDTSKGVLISFNKKAAVAPTN